MSLTHIIFDLDGTLSATAQATLRAVETARKQFQDLPQITLDNITDAMGLHGLEFHKKLFPTVALDTLQQVEKAIDELELDNIHAIGRDILFPGVITMLETLREKKCTLYIASTGNDAHVHGTLAATGIASFFTGISCNQPQKIDMVRNIINGNDPKKWAMVGDMFKDSEAAKGNDILALGAGFGYLSKEDEELFDAVLREPNDILQYI